MADDRTPDSVVNRVSVDDQADVQKWAKKLNVTPDQIKEAVAAVGDHADNVEMHLKGTRATTNADQEKRIE